MTQQDKREGVGIQKSLKYYKVIKEQPLGNTNICNDIEPDSGSVCGTGIHFPSTHWQAPASSQSSLLQVLHDLQKEGPLTPQPAGNKQLLEKVQQLVTYLQDFLHCPFLQIQVTSARLWHIFPFIQQSFGVLQELSAAKLMKIKNRI